VDILKGAYLMGEKKIRLEAVFTINKLRAMIMNIFKDDIIIGTNSSIFGWPSLETVVNLLSFD
jgi:hypothetical protein